MIRSNEEEKEVGKSYGFLQARKDVAKGKVAKVPLWDDKTEKRFNEYCKMLHAKDFPGIKKAFGDNVQDNVSNWTPTEFRSELVRLAYQSSIALQKCTIIPMSRDKMDLPAPSGNYTVAWVDAAGATLDSKITIGKVSLDSAKLYGIALVNQEDLDDPAYPLASVIAAQLGEDFGKKIDEEVFQGDDSDTTNHRFDGIEFATSVQAVTGGTDDTPSFVELLTEDNLIETVGKLDDLQIDGAEWYFINSAFNAIRKLEDGANSKIVRLNENYKYDILGFPLNLRAQVGTTATCARAAGFFGNLKWVYIGDRMNMSIDTSEHYRFANDQVVFRALQRLAVKVALPTALVRIMFAAHS
jgi:HK97 family phage major capsid protein